MAPIFETIMNKNSSSNPSSQSSSSSSFIVRNHAIGNNPCFPYDACITTHLGDDVDILLWEQSMNCGREVLPLQVFTTIAAYHMKKQPTVIYLLSGGPTWTKSFCEQLYANSSSSSEGRDDGGSSSRSSGSGSNSFRDSRRINQLRNLSDLEINLLQNDMRTNANLSHHGFLHQFRFLHDDNDDSYIAERFSNSAPMAQVSYEVMIIMMLLLMIIMMVMVVAMMMMMMLLMLMMVSVNKFLMLAFFTSL